MRDIELRESGFSAGEEMARFAHENPGAGAIASFVGKVRPVAAGNVPVHALHLTHYEPLTLPAMVDLASAAKARFNLQALLIHHRIGYVKPGAAIVLVCAAAIHRRGAFDAVDYAMDHLKSAAWFWKREKRGAEWEWIEPRAQDHVDLTRWAQS